LYGLSRKSRQGSQICQAAAIGGLNSFRPSLRRKSWTVELLDLLSALLSQPLLWILLGVSCGWMALFAPLGLLVVIGFVHLRNPDR